MTDVTDEARLDRPGPFPVQGGVRRASSGGDTDVGQIGTPHGVEWYVLG